MNDSEKPLVDQPYLLKKFPGKGGWTYAAIPDVLPDKSAHFGWVKVRGRIDSFEFSNYRLMSMGNGRLFLPVKAEIRKKIGKKEGDWVHIVLHADNNPQELPDELRDCLMDEPPAYDAFLACSDTQQKAYIDWIYSAKTDETKVERILKTIEALLGNQKRSAHK